ncbi:MAG: PAS domain S-box protein, partial [Leptolyngbyaceae bacterium]|nr:PAS domain S-box protein [Leptolyngbyaceae bacterium]
SVLYSLAVSKAVANAASTFVMKLPFKAIRSVSLPTALIIPLVIEIVSIVGIVGYLSFRNGQQAVNTLAAQLRQELTERIKRELQSYFETPHEINRLNASAFSRGELDIVNAQFGEEQLYQQMKIAPNVAFVYCGSARKGEFFGVLRSPDTGQLQLSYGNESNNFLRDYYTLDVNGERTFWMRRAETPFDARIRPWFRAATAVQRAAWTDVYIAFSTGLPNVTASLPVYDKVGRQLLGVCATDVVLPEEFRSFLKNLEIGISGQAFVVDRTGDLIANSTDEPLMQGKGESATSLPAVNSQDDLVRGTAHYLIATFGGFEGIRTVQRLEFQLNGKRQFLEVVPFRDDFGLDWLIVVVVPEADFIGQITANTRTTVILCAIALAIALAIAMSTARLVTRPIVRIAKASEAIAQGNLNQHIETSSLLELNRLATSFNSMSRQLQDSFQLLESKNEALRIAEETYRGIFENALEGIFQATPEGRLLNINAAMADIYGYDSPQEMMQKVNDIRPHLLMLEDERDRFQQQIQTHGEVKAFEGQSKRQDGSIIWVQIDVRAVKNNVGDSLYNEGIVQDISERIEREDMLRRQLEELKIEIDQQKREMAVNQITQSTYFQEIKEEMARIDLDEFWG